MRRASASLTALSLLAVVGLSGCSVLGPRTSHDPDADRIRKNPTPELHTLHETPHDVQNVIAIMQNENARMRNQDAQRVLMIDRPSRLTREPVPW